MMLKLCAKTGWCDFLSDVCQIIKQSAFKQSGSQLCTTIPSIYSHDTYVLQLLIAGLTFFLSRLIMSFLYFSSLPALNFSVLLVLPCRVFLVPCNFSWPFLQCPSCLFPWILPVLSFRAVLQCPACIVLQVPSCLVQPCPSFLVLLHPSCLSCSSLPFCPLLPIIVLLHSVLPLLSYGAFLSGAILFCPTLTFISYPLIG